MSPDLHERLSDSFRSQVLSGPDVLPTLFELAGHRGWAPANDRDGRSALAGTTRTLVSEDRRDLYLKDRFRFNFDGRHKNMTEEDLERNRRLSERFAEPPAIRSFLRHPDKCIVTSLKLKPNGGAAADRAALAELGSNLVGSAVLVANGNHLLAFERFDLSSDPKEAQNLLNQETDGLASLLGSSWAHSISMPVAGKGEVDLVTLSDGSQLPVAAG